MPQQQNRYDVLFVDADQTLFDFKQAERAAFRQVFGPDQGLFDRYQAINHALWEMVERNQMTQTRLRTLRFERLLAQERLPGSAGEWSERFAGALSQQGILLPGALEGVVRWATRVRLFILTNGIADIQRGRMAASPIAPYIQGMVISEEVGAAKPDARMAQAALALAGITDPSRALILGDSLSADIACARGAGIDSCWLNPEGLSCGDIVPTYTVTCLAQVDELL